MSFSDPETLLREARSRTTQRIAELAAVFNEIVETSHSANLDDEHDPEGATVGFERAQVSALLDRARAQLEEIDAAVERLRDGTYGVCDTCGESIARARLAAQPAARRCIACAP